VGGRSSTSYRTVSTPVIVPAVAWHSGGVPRLLVVHHSPTPTVQALTDAVLAGARDDAIEGVEVVERVALDGSADDVLGADGYLLGTTANFGYMSGALKHFFDTIFLDAGGALSDDGSASPSTGGKKPYGLWVHGRYDTTGAVRSVQSIVQALPWTQSAEVLEVLGDVGEEQKEAAYELGATIAALLSE
jgi:multimeric flavodoxin WrbA